MTPSLHRLRYKKSRIGASNFVLDLGAGIIGGRVLEAKFSPFLWKLCGKKRKEGGKKRKECGKKKESEINPLESVSTNACVRAARLEDVGVTAH